MLAVVHDCELAWLSDHQLMEKVAEDDPDAFAEIYRRHERQLRFFFTALGRDAELAGDLVQDTFISLWRARTTYQPTGQVEQYLFAIARNLWLNHKRGISRRPAEDRDCEQHVLELVRAEAASQPEEILLIRECRRLIDAAIDRLPEPQRLVFVMSHQLGMKYNEIAVSLHIPVGTVKYRMHEAVHRLREELKDERR